MISIDFDNFILSMCGHAARCKNGIVVQLPVEVQSLRDLSLDLGRRYSDVGLVMFALGGPVWCPKRWVDDIDAILPLAPPSVEFQMRIVPVPLKKFQAEFLEADLVIRMRKSIIHNADQKEVYYRHDDGILYPTT